MSSLFFETLATAAILIFFSEIGDKTNLVALSLMGKYKRSFLVAGSGILAITITSTIGVIIGITLGNILPFSLINFVAAGLFIFLGVISLVENFTKDEESLNQKEEVVEASSLQIASRSMGLIMLAEIGDKSQLLIISGALFTDPIALLLGAIIGMAAVMVVTAFFGESFLRKVPEDKLSILTALLFVIVGFWLLLDTLIF